jgi:protoheme IX farnesyltransferase
VVRVTESGLGCPDWPLCHGKLIPPLEFETLIEYSHRLAASLTSTLILATVIMAWWRYRRLTRIVAPVTLALVLLGIEVVLGGITVLTELPPTIVTVHLAVAETIFALLLITLIAALRQPGQDEEAARVYPWALGAAAATFVVLMSGSYAVGRGAGTICPGWPFCHDGLLPSTQLAWIHMAHRMTSLVAGLVAVWAAALAWRHRRSHTGMGVVAVTAGGALAVQVLLGAANPWTGFSIAARAAHLSMATAVWGSYVAMAALSWRPRSAPSAPGRNSLMALVLDYVALTKPMILVLLLVTALGGMFLAAGGAPPVSTALLVLLGGSLGAGGANALNHYLDQDLDERMQRTRSRPLPGNRVRPWHAVVFGIALNIAAFAILALWVNLLSALLVLGATLFYVFVYTMWLKRSTTQNIVIGGAAGAIPPVVGWAAITGGVGLPALFLFAIVFFWTPPHFWALSMLLKDDYARAGVPMLPVEAGIPATTRSIMLHSVLMVTITILFITVAAVGWLYSTGAIMLGAGFLYMAWRLLRAQTMQAARRLYLYSLLYLMVLFVLIIADSIATP